MSTGVVINVAENLFNLLRSQDFKDICSMFGYESQLDELALTVSTIKAVLLDAESKHQELTHGGREYIEGLKGAVYDVDDVLDGFNILFKKEQNKQGGKTFKDVRRFFSRSNQLLVAFNMSHEIKKLRDKLDAISKNRQQFGFSDVYVPVKKRRETGSYAREESIIGRQADKEAIIGMLLDESDHQTDIPENVAFVTIVGMGGLGKTALAQLVYNDKKILEAFEARMWVCVSDEFGVEEIFAKMMGKDAGFGTEELQRDVRNVIEGRKYLLVFDDVWDENHNKWVELRDFLVLGGRGSRVVTTTRSKAVATAIGNNHTYELQGLSDEHSWHLFQNMAFEQGKTPLDGDLVDIGKEVVKKCANVPLSIRVVSSLLYGQHKSKWLSFKSIDLRNLGCREDGKPEDGILPILKYSYYHLSPSLKSCFSLCALFPKDFKINKTKLIWLWMAHGCLDLSNDGQNMEAVGEDYFLILLHRCFFQDIQQDTDGEIYSCKMHDLMHDLAKEVAGKESLVLETTAIQFDKKIRHLSIGNDGCKLMCGPWSCLGDMKKLRSLRHNFDQSFSPAVYESNVGIICSNLERLRVLDLAFFGVKTLPNTLANLLHLRYLDLSLNGHLEILPESITKLRNLLVLNLRASGVRELPTGLRKLHNLRHLDLFGCRELTHMPVGMDSMTNLQTLSMFVVAGKTSKQVKRGQLKDLRSLVHLKGRLEIIFRNGFSNDSANAMEVNCLLSNKKHLKDLVIHWEDERQNDEYNVGALHEMLLEGLCPNSNIIGIEIRGYKGIKLPTWLNSLATFLPRLARVSLHGFDWLYSLPSVSQLLHLKVFELSTMPNVEFIQSSDDVSLSHSTTPDRLPIFQSLEELVLRRLPKLKGVWNADVLMSEFHRKLGDVIRSFPRLHKLEIDGCPCIRGVPRCPSLKTLKLLGLHSAFRFRNWGIDAAVSNSRSADLLPPNLALLDGLPHINNDSSTYYLDYLEVDKVSVVNLLFGGSLKGINRLYILGFQQENFSAAVKLFQRYASSLRHVSLSRCYGLKSLCGGGLEYLTNLRYLGIGRSNDLDLGAVDECGITPWKSLKSLSQLDLWFLSNMTYLPEGFQHLHSLRTLRLRECNLESLPEWLSCLTLLSFLWLQSCKELKSLPEAIRHLPSLKQLRIWDCAFLSDTCREPDGQDWPKISHIPILDIRSHI